MLGILEDALRIGPSTVLTNATLITRERAQSLAAIARASRYSLEVRVSLDGTTAERNDPLRGEGSFAATLRGVETLAAARAWPGFAATILW